MAQRINLSDLPRHARLFFIVEDEANTRVFSEFAEVDAVFKQFAKWLNEFVIALQDNGDYEKYKEYIIEISRIMGELKKLTKENKR